MFLIVNVILQINFKHALAHGTAHYLRTHYIKHLPRYLFLITFLNGDVFLISVYKLFFNN